MYRCLLQIKAPAWRAVPLLICCRWVSPVTCRDGSVAADVSPTCSDILSHGTVTWCVGKVGSACGFALVISAWNSFFFKSTYHLPRKCIHLWLRTQVGSETSPRKTTHFSNSSFELVHLWFYWDALSYNILLVGRHCRRQLSQMTGSSLPLQILRVNFSLSTLLGHSSCPKAFIPTCGHNSQITVPTLISQNVRSRHLIASWVPPLGRFKTRFACPSELSHLLSHPL